MRDPFAARLPRPADVPAGVSMLEEARLVGERHAAERDALSGVDRSLEGESKADDKTEEPDGVKVEDPTPSGSHTASGKPVSP